MTPPPVIDEAFFEHLTEEDEMGVVLRAQIHIEASVIEFINARIPFPEHLPRLPFEARLRLACALGLRKDYFEILKFLGELRNRFAHNLNVQLDNSTLRKLHEKLPQEGIDISIQTYENTMAQRGETDYAPFSKIPPKDRFVLIAVILKGFVVTAVHNAKTSQCHV